MKFITIFTLISVFTSSALSAAITHTDVQGTYKRVSRERRYCPDTVEIDNNRLHTILIYDVKSQDSAQSWESCKMNDVEQLSFMPVGNLRLLYVEAVFEMVVPLTDSAICTKRADEVNQNHRRRSIPGHYSIMVESNDRFVLKTNLCVYEKALSDDQKLKFRY